MTRTPTRTAVALATVLALSLGACSADEPERPTTMPDVTLAGFDGGEAVDLGELRGPALVNLWASWCGPCREEMPLLEEFHQQHGDEVSVLGIDYQDAQPVKAAELVAQTGVTYPLRGRPRRRGQRRRARSPTCAGCPSGRWSTPTARSPTSRPARSTPWTRSWPWPSEHLGVTL